MRVVVVKHQDLRTSLMSNWQWRVNNTYCSDRMVIYAIRQGMMFV